ncbi:MAG: hypothetical protein HZRFUVUK_001170 [Candidatus Fervidibacterota bacterium]
MIPSVSYFRFREGGSMAKIKVDWEKLKEFSPENLLALERELMEAIRQEWEERRQARLQNQEAKEKRKK